MVGYRLLRLAGKGGMGHVFEAEQLSLGRTVALKLILTGWSVESDFRARFEREVETLARLDHPNVVQVYDAGVWCGQPYLTMKFVRGKTLAHWLPKLRTDLPAACRVLATVARAVAYLHSKNVVHRDLKPLNVLMSEDGTPYVADFGLARARGRIGNHRARATGGHAAVHVARAGRGRSRSRAVLVRHLALGVILYELLAGDRPFESEDRNELFALIRRAPTPPIAQHMLAPVELEAIARKCLAKDPADRYQSAEELAEHLEAWARGEPIELPPEPPAPAPAEPARPRAAVVRSNWVRVALGACVVLALASGGAPAPSAPPTLEHQLDRGDTVVLLDGKGEAKFVVEPTLPGSALHAHEGGFAMMSGITYQIVRFNTGPLKFPLEVSADVMHLNPKDLPNYGGLALGQQGVSSGGIDHELVWTFGLTGGPRNRVGNQIHITDRVYGQVVSVNRFDKRHYYFPTINV